MSWRSPSGDKVRMDWDAIVVGAGPAGCAAATFLARDGIRVLLLEKSSLPTPRVCGEYLSPGCLPILERLGVLSDLRQAGARPIRGMQLHTARGRSWQIRFPSPRTSPNVVHGLAIPRELLDSHLLRAANAAGVQFQAEFQSADLLREDGCVAGVSGRLQGRIASFRGRLVVGADGRNSVVARRLGAVERLAWLEKMALVAHMEGVERAEDFGEIFLGTDRYAILNPVTPASTNVGVVLSRRDFSPGADPSSLLREVAVTLPGLAPRLRSAGFLGRVRCLGPLAYRVSHLAVPGCALIGDATGFLDPFTGEGIYAGLRSAELAARFALAELRERRSDAPDMRAYGAAWRRETAARWRLCALLQRVLRRRLLAHWLVALLAASPPLANRLTAAIGNLSPERT